MIGRRCNAGFSGKPGSCCYNGLQEGREAFHVLGHAVDFAAKLVHFRSKRIHFLLFRSFGVVALSDFRQEIGASPLELVMTELPVFGFVVIHGVAKAERVRLDLAKAVKVQLTNKGRKVVVLEELPDNFRGEELGVLHHESKTIIRPASNVFIASIDHVVGLSQEDRCRLGCLLLLLSLVASLLVSLGGVDFVERRRCHGQSCCCCCCCC
mmetsp:Transcript_60424/g.167192  ORF Transcript_60424/g.167192 Transcript_60424/m.167192 type:complete len:210 (+) Transcript_60424:197-826(+)